MGSLSNPPKILEAELLFSFREIFPHDYEMQVHIDHAGEEESSFETKKLKN